MSTPNIPDGQLVFYNHPDHAWILGSVAGALDPKKGYPIKDKDNGGATLTVSAANVYPVMNESILTEDVNDLLLLSELHQSTLLNTLRHRYFQDIVYTYIGPIVIAINPFNYNIPWYKDDFMPNYLSEGTVIQKNKPHSWSVAHNTYYEMLQDKENQSVLVSGESGAGKTEAVKIVIKYIRGLMGKLARDEAHRETLAEINRKILLASPILESFGNAKTGRNDNSSRFGKFLQLQFDDAGYIQGSFAIPYLLEKSRVVTAAQGERIYHAFYQVAKGKDASQYTLAAPKEYPSLIAGGTLDNASMEDAEGDDLSYRMTNEAYAVCGIDGDAGKATWRVLAGILRLLKVTFVPDGDKATWGPGAETEVDAAATLFGLKCEDLKRELLQTRGEVRGEVFVMDHTPAAATTIRNSLVMTVYNGLFLWLFDTINAGTQATDPARWIGLLDIFGFEDFKVNSFEQLCINLANETLQNHYNDYIFDRDMNECKAEGIDVTAVAFVDNKPTCQLLTAKGGIFALLDDECALGKGTDLGFLEKICDSHKEHKAFKKENLWKSAFAIRHYAGTVKYEVENFLIKNKDTLKDALKDLFRTSSCAVTAVIVPPPVEKKGGRAPTISATFVGQIQALMDMINCTNPHWIRCVKPHPAKKPRMLHGASTMSQMINSGVIETVRIRQLGYPVRLPLGRFLERFACIARAAGKTTSPDDVVGSCERIIAAAGYPKTEAQIGKTKVFLKSHTYQDVEVKKRECLQSSATLVQAAARRIPSVDVMRRLIFEKNKGIIDELRKQYAKLLDLSKTEGEVRTTVESEWATVFEGIDAEFKRTDPAWSRRLEAVATEGIDGAKAIIAECGNEWSELKRGLCEGAAALVEAERQRKAALIRAKKEEEAAARRARELELEAARQKALAETRAAQQAAAAARIAAQQRRAAAAEAAAAAQEMKTRDRQRRAAAATERVAAARADRSAAVAVKVVATEAKHDAVARRRAAAAATRERDLIAKHEREAERQRGVAVAAAAWAAAADQKAALIEVEKTDDAVLGLMQTAAARRRQDAVAAGTRDRLGASGTATTDSGGGRTVNLAAAHRAATGGGRVMTSTPQSAADIVAERAYRRTVAAERSAVARRVGATGGAGGRDAADRARRRLWDQQQAELAASTTAATKASKATSATWAAATRYRDAKLHAACRPPPLLDEDGGGHGQVASPAMTPQRPVGGSASPGRSGRSASPRRAPVSLTAGELAGFVTSTGKTLANPLQFKVDVKGVSP